MATPSSVSSYHGSDHATRWSAERTLPLLRGLPTDVDSYADVCRVPGAQKEIEGENFALRNRELAGARLPFSTDAAVLSGRIETERNAFLTVTRRQTGEVVGTCRISSAGTFRFDGLAGHDVPYELWLPHNKQTLALEIEVDSPSSLSTLDSQKDQWLAYGSSITQGFNLTGPHESWVSQIALRTGIEHRNLGFASGALLDRSVATQIARTPASLISICTGINVHTSSTMTVRDYRSALFAFLMTIAEAQSTVPLLVMSPIASNDREQAASSPRYLPLGVRRQIGRALGRAGRAHLTGPTLSEIRQATADVAERAAAAGAAITCLDGLTLLGVHEQDLLDDGLHPGVEGHRQIADRVLAQAKEAFDSAGVTR